MEAFLKKKMKMIKKIISNSETETIKIGKNIALSFKKGDIVGFYGNLGAGKTLLIKGILSFFKFSKKEVISPTFLFVKEFHNKKITIYHFDLYRKENYKELLEKGFRENYLSDENAIILIEWVDKIKEVYKFLNYVIKLEHLSEKKRKIIIYKKI